MDGDCALSWKVLVASRNFHEPALIENSAGWLVLCGRRTARLASVASIYSALSISEPLTWNVPSTELLSDAPVKRRNGPRGTAGMPATFARDLASPKALAVTPATSASPVGRNFAVKVSEPLVAP